MNVNGPFRAGAKNGVLDGENTEDAIENWLKFKDIHRRNGCAGQYY
jgi:hypothetical protein